MEVVHTPVLLQECLSLLSPVGEPYEDDALMVDSTLGEGGHSFRFLSEYPGLRVIGVDADRAIQARARERLAPFDGRVEFFSGWFDDFFRDFPPDARRPNLVLFDLGISVFHYDRSGRGFSFRHDEELDMRLDPASGESAADVVNGMEEGRLADLLYLYSDERYSRRIASAITTARRTCRVASTKALADIVAGAVPPQYRHGPIHPATRTFQALRIYVNHELKRLPGALHAAFNTLLPQGKLGVITFHSLEDRIVKRYFRGLARECVCPPGQGACSCGGSPCAMLLTRKGVEPGPEEVAANSPSRSARLRVIRKIRDAGKERLRGVDAV